PSLRVRRNRRGGSDRDAGLVGSRSRARTGGAPSPPAQRVPVAPASASRFDASRGSRPWTRLPARARRDRSRSRARCRQPERAARGRSQKDSGTLHAFPDPLPQRSASTAHASRAGWFGRREPVRRMNPASCAKALVVASALGTPEAAFAELHGSGPAGGMRASAPLPAAASGSRYEARQRFDRGLAAYNAGDFMGALAELQRAHAIVAHPLVLYNIALVQARLGHVVESLEALEHLERSGLASLAPERQQRARELRATLSERVGSIRIETDVENALIQVDGVDVGRTPSPPIRVAAGVHLVSVSAQGYEPRRFRTLVAGKATEVIELALVPLQQPLSRLEVITNVPDVQVRANGELLGQTPLETPFSLKPGEYALELVRDGYAPWQRRVSPPPGPARPAGRAGAPAGPARPRGARPSVTDAQLAA